MYNEADKARIATAKAKKAAQKAAVKPTEPKPKGRAKGTTNKPKEENPTASFRVYKVLIRVTVAQYRDYPCREPEK